MNSRKALERVLPGLFIAILICAGSTAVNAYSQSQQQSPQAGDDKPSQSSATKRLRIEVTGGEKNQPVESASVYVRYVEERKLRKNKKHEMNVKTNQDGIAHVPDPPMGKVQIQVVAEGWKPFGKVYDIEDLSQPIQIHLEKAKQWY